MPIFSVQKQFVTMLYLSYVTFMFFNKSLVMFQFTLGIILFIYLVLVPL